jgi:transposase-like protein
MEQIEAPALWRKPPANGYSLFLSLPRQRPTLQTMNVLNCLPKSAQAKAKQALHAIWKAETKADAEKAFDLFIETYEPKYPKATVCLQKDREELLAFRNLSTSLRHSH